MMLLQGSNKKMKKSNWGFKSTPEQIGDSIKYISKRMRILHMIAEINEESVVELNLDVRELKMLQLCREYAKDSFGAPNHLLMVLVNKLWDYIVENKNES